MIISNLIIGLNREPHTGPIRMRVVKSSNFRGEPMVFDISWKQKYREEDRVANFARMYSNGRKVEVITFPKMCCGQPVITEPKLIGRDPVNICRVTDQRAIRCSPPKFLPPIDLVALMEPNPNGIAITRRSE